MAVTRNFIRTFLLSILGAIIVSILLGLAIEWVIELAREFGAFEHPSERAGEAVSAVWEFVTQTWFVVTFAVFTGLTVGVWSNIFLKKLENIQPSELTRSVPILEMQVLLYDTNKAAPWIEFHCWAFNGTGHTICLKTASGRIRVGPETFQSELELNTNTSDIDYRDYFAFVLKLPLTAKEAEHLDTFKLKGQHLRIRFIDGTVSAEVCHLIFGHDFNIAIMDEVTFDMERNAFGKMSLRKQIEEREASNYDA